MGLITRIGSLVLGSSIGPFCYEAVSWVGRLCSRSYVPVSGRDIRFNLGSGPRYLDGFVNTDFFLGVGRKDFRADLRYPLRVPDGIAMGIFSEHTLEHLTYSQVDRLLRECYRILKPGGRVRLIVPDVHAVAAAYVKADAAWLGEWERLMFLESGAEDRRHRRLRFPVEALSFVTQEYGHRSCWDYDALAGFLSKAGFVDVQRKFFRKGQDPALLVDTDAEARRLVSLYVEAGKAGS